MSLKKRITYLFFSLLFCILEGCSEDSSTSVEESSVVPQNKPTIESSLQIPELYIYTNNGISLDYINAYFYFFDASKHFSYFSPTNDFDDSGKIKIRGNSTASSPKKPYNIKFDEKKDFFGMGKAKKWVLLSNPFDPTLIRNKLIYDLSKQLSFVFSPESYFIDVWLNDTFMGNYQITEKIEFQKNRIPYSTDDGDFLFEMVESEKRTKGNTVYTRTPIDSIRVAFAEPEEPSSKQIEDFSKKMKRIEEAIATKDFRQYAKYVDLRSIIDYYWIEEFVNDPDLHTGSVFFTIHDNILRGGPVWDFDLALGNTKSAQKTLTTGFHAQKAWWQELFKDSVFQKITFERYQQIAPYFDNLANDNELGNNKIDSLLDFFKESFYRNFSDSTWAYCDSINSNDNARELNCPYNQIPYPTFDENIQFLRNWITERNSYIKEKVHQKLNSLKEIPYTLEQVLAIQDSILDND